MTSLRSSSAAATAAAEDDSESTLRRSLEQLNASHSALQQGGGSSSEHADGDADEMTADEQQLSEDLALFLSNPSLRAALSDGSLNLASYSNQIQAEIETLELQCIAIYRSKQDEIGDLQTELQDCIAVLNALHEMLLGFQADLGGLSGEIRQLQEKSRSLDVALKNRRQAESGMRNFLQHLVVSPTLAAIITGGDATSTAASADADGNTSSSTNHHHHHRTTHTVNPTFLQAVQELNQIYRDAHSRQPAAWACDTAPADTQAGSEMQVQVQTLRLLAASRVRDYFLQQLALLRRSQTNVRMIQVHGLVKYAALMDFLEEACPEIATEIWNVYMESMSHTLQQLFRTYQAQLLQLDATKAAASRQDVIAIDDALLRDSLTTRAKKRVDVFCLGQRAVECLAVGGGGGNPHDAHHAHHHAHHAGATAAAAAAAATSPPQPILAHVALAENQRYPYERLFRSLLGHLVDAVTNEHVFCRQFFKRDAFNELFNGTLSLLLEQLENYLFGCYDALCLLLMIKVTHSYKRLARHRRIHSLDPFLDQITKLVWPRLKIVMEGHLRSLKQATAQKLGGVDLHAHYISRRLAEFTCSILLILQNNTTTTGKPPNLGRSQSAAAETTTGGANKSRNSISGGNNNNQTPMRSPSFLRRSSSATTPGSSSHAMDELTSSMSAGEKLLEDLMEIVDEYIVLLERLADQHGSQKKKIVFTINNLDQVVSIFQERRVVGEEFNKFVQHLMRQREYFVEVELLTGFSKMIAFVQQTEVDMAAAPKGQPYQVNIQEVEALVLDFASNWKSNIDLINRNVLSYFSNFRNGMEILKQVLTQLLLYYTRFQDIIRKVWRNKPPAFCKDLVSTTVILAEIKKHALAI